MTRQIICGQGRVGLGQQGSDAGFQISQRADFFEVEVGLETTLKRPIINTRDEPHADADKYRRLHVIIGDANLAEVAGLLKVGTTSLVLAMIEDGFLDGDPADRAAGRTSCTRSRTTPTSRHRVELRDGRADDARSSCSASTATRPTSSSRTGSAPTSTTTRPRSCARWEQVLDDLGTTTRAELAGQLDWVAKRQILEGYRSRDGLDWSDARLQLVDLQYSDVRPDKGLYHRLAATGRMERILTDETTSTGRAPAAPRTPEPGSAVSASDATADQVAAASWDSVIFDVPGRVSLQRVPMLEPLRGTRAHVGDLLDRCETAAELVDALTA